MGSNLIKTSDGGEFDLGVVVSQKLVEHWQALVDIGLVFRSLLASLVFLLKLFDVSLGDFGKSGGSSSLELSSGVGVSVLECWDNQVYNLVH